MWFVQICRSLLFPIRKRVWLENCPSPLLAMRTRALHGAAQGRRFSAGAYSWLCHIWLWGHLKQYQIVISKRNIYSCIYLFIHFFNTCYFRLYLVVLYCWYVHFRLYEYKIVRMLYCTNIYNILLCIEYISNWIHSLVWYYTSDSNDEDLLCCRLPSIAD